MSDGYHTSPGISWSQLQPMMQSPLHYLHALHVERTETPAMRLGTAAHVAVLEPDTWDDCYVVAGPMDRRTKEGKAAWAALQDDPRVVLTEAEAATAQAMAEAVRAHPVAAGLLSSGAPEVVLRWQEEGRLCRGRADWLGDQHVIDLKTGRQDEPRWYGRTVAQRGIHGQLAGYRRGAAEAQGCPREWLEVYVVHVDSSPPHDVQVWRMGADVLEAGEALRGRLLRRLAECEASGVWPGAMPGVRDIELPEWAREDT